MSKDEQENGGDEAVFQVLLLHPVVLENASSVKFSGISQAQLMKRRRQLISSLDLLFKCPEEQVRNINNKTG